MAITCCYDPLTLDGRAGRLEPPSWHTPQDPRINYGITYGITVYPLAELTYDIFWYIMLYY